MKIKYKAKCHKSLGEYRVAIPIFESLDEFGAYHNDAVGAINTLVEKTVLAKTRSPKSRKKQIVDWLLHKGLSYDEILEEAVDVSDNAT
jgi:hypothetical protein